MGSMKIIALIPLIASVAFAAPESPPAGKILSEKAVVKVSSTCEYDTPEHHLNLVRGEVLEMAFHTKNEKNPWVILKLDRAAEIKRVEIKNRPGQNAERSATLTMSFSDDGKTWQEIWAAKGKAEQTWDIPVADASGKGRKAGWVKLELKPKGGEFFHLSRVTLFSEQ
jgi:hypothetical protein